MNFTFRETEKTDRIFEKEKKNLRNLTMKSDSMTNILGLKYSLLEDVVVVLSA